MPEEYCDATGKISYRSRVKATKARSSFRSKFKRPDSHGQLEAFQCRSCGLWHLGRHGLGKRAQR